MFKNPSLDTRIVVGKTIGFAIGMAGLVFMPVFLPEIGWMPRIGIVLWYTSMGAIVGMFGVANTLPVLGLSLPWWVRGLFVGAWLNFVLVFFAEDLMVEMMVVVFGVDGVLQSPFWFVLEGALVAFVIEYFATKFGGDGPATAGK